MKNEPAPSTRLWTNSSVTALCGTADPIAAIISRARAVVLEAKDKGWSGPPFDPLLLAEYLNIPVVPREDIGDARTVPVKGSTVQVEFNPNRPRGRMRYSVAHEIAHTLFPDCADRVRNRQKRDEIEGDEWQLEMLCNIGAAELLMPIGSFPALRDESLTVDHLMELRKQFDVSSEAIFLRVVRLTEQRCAMFVASRDESEGSDGSYQIDYALGSRSWSDDAPKGMKLPHQSVIAECTAIGYTAKRAEEWPGISGKLHIECVGIPPYPQRRYPRVVGLATTPRKGGTVSPQIVFLKGDATNPRGAEHRIVAQVVNDKTPNWGAGFALAVRKKWPEAQQDFQDWVKSDPKNLSLGRVHLAVQGDVGVLDRAKLLCRQMKPNMQRARSLRSPLSMGFACQMKSISQTHQMALGISSNLLPRSVRGPRLQLISQSCLTDVLGNPDRGQDRFL